MDVADDTNNFGLCLWLIRSSDLKYSLGLLNFHTLMNHS